MPLSPGRSEEGQAPVAGKMFVLYLLLSEDCRCRCILQIIILIT